MNQRQSRASNGAHARAFVLAVVLGVMPTPAVMGQSTECLVEFGGNIITDANKNGGVLQCTEGCASCDADSTPNQCTFRLKVCRNQGACSATGLKKVIVKGRCSGTSTLGVTAAGPTCSDGAVVVKLTKKNRRPGKCKIMTKAISSGPPRRMDKDILTLVCNPAGQPCPSTTSTTVAAPTTTTTTTTSTSVTAITAPCGANVTTTTLAGVCAPIVPGQAIPNTYLLHGTTGEKRCTTTSSNACNAGSRINLGCTTDDTNATTGCPGASCPGCCLPTRFKTCSADADCGGTAGGCLDLPWVTADGQVMPFSTGTQTTFTVNTEDSFPTCEHNLCIRCGNPNHMPCPGIPGCEVAGNPNGCVPRGTQGCCDEASFIVPTFFVNILGGLCSRVDQIGCGGGVVNTSRPQTGHNKVSKNGDTSDPGADCCYNGHPGSECLGGVNLNDDPAPLPCNVNGAGDDYNGKIVKTIGGGNADADGIHFRYTVPELSTTWTDGQSPAGTCADGSTYDDGELLISQLILKADTTTSGATGSFTDQNGDGCKRAGAGFISSSNSETDGPITVPGAEGGGPARPQPYDDCSGSVAASVSEVFSGPNSPIRDIGFVAITPNMPAVVVPAVTCSCTVTPDCPE